jgi:hypothetical protein
MSYFQDKLKTFFDRFQNNTVSPMWLATKDCELYFSMADVSKTFKRVAMLAMLPA